PASRSAPAEKPASAGEGDDLSLDFTGFMPAKPASSSAPASSAPAAVTAPTRRADPAPVSEPAKNGYASEAPSLGLSVSIPAAPSSTGRSNRPPDSIMSIEVTGSSSDIAPVIEEAAILFANGQAQEALAKLSRSVREDDLGEFALQCWLMLFDLYQHL